MIYSMITKGVLKPMNRTISRTGREKSEQPHHDRYRTVTVTTEGDTLQHEKRYYIINPPDSLTLRFCQIFWRAIVQFHEARINFIVL